MLATSGGWGHTSCAGTERYYRYVDGGTGRRQVRRCKDKGAERSWGTPAGTACALCVMVTAFSSWSLASASASFGTSTGARAFGTSTNSPKPMKADEVANATRVCRATSKQRRPHRRRQARKNYALRNRGGPTVHRSDASAREEFNPLGGSGHQIQVPHNVHKTGVPQQPTRTCEGSARAGSDAAADDEFNPIGGSGSQVPAG
jgi:hypothetical protein